MEKLVISEGLQSVIFKKVCLIWVVILIFAFRSQANGFSQDKRISLNYDQVNLGNLLTEIEQNTHKNFLYNLKDVDLDKKVPSYEVDKPLEEVLQAIVKDLHLGYKIDGDQIVLFPVERGGQIAKKKEDSLLSTSGVQQEQTITGTVTDENGMPLPGVNIMVEGTNRGTQTDFDGEYTIEAERGEVLIFSFVGFQDQTIEIGDDDSIQITMEESTSSLDEVVVVGYSKLSKRDVTSSIDIISSDDIDKPMTSLGQGLQGVSPNVNININSGKAFEQPEINIRGETSIGQGGSALVLIDGVEGDISMVNPSDVESISVLKGPAASAQYGARAAFGVLQITTKEGTEGGFSINLNSRVGLKEPALSPGFVTDGLTYLEGFHEAYLNGQGFEPKSINKTQPFSLEYLEEFRRHQNDPSLPEVMINDEGEYVYYTSTDWYKELYKDRLLNQTYDVSASGGDERASFIVTGRYQDQEGLFRYNSDDYNMYNLRAKGRVKLFSWLELSNNFSYSKRKYFNPLNVGEGGGIWRNIQDEGHPTSPLLNPDGTLSFASAYTVGDFYYGKNGKGFDNQVLRNQVELNGKFFENKLTLTGNFSYENTRADISEKRVPVPYSTVEGVTSLLGDNQNSIAITRGSTNYFTSNFYGEYKNTFGDGHNVDLTAGMNYERRVHNEVFVERNGILFGDADNINLALGDGISTSGLYDAWNLFGLFYQLNYNYKNRYLVTMSGRYDGNSRFPSNERYGFFPSFSAGWFISEEPFWNLSEDLISGLKFRGSYGSLGNGNVAPYSYLELLPIERLTKIINGELPQSVSNPNVIPDGLTWETVTTMGFGLDLWMFNDRLSLAADYYVRNTKDMFTTALTPPRVFGAPTPKGNYADLQTKGWEVSLTWRDQIKDVFGKELGYSIGLQASDNTAKITKYNNPEMNLDDHYVGERIGEIWGYVTEGIFQSEDEIANHANQDNFLNPHTPDGTYQVGYLKYKDLDGDGEINDGDNRADSSGDRKVIGNSHPRYRFGANLGFDWNNFFVSAFFEGVGKRDWYPSNEADNFWGQYNRPYNQLPEWHLKEGNIWTPDNPDGFLPRKTGYEALEGDLNEAQTRYLMNVAYVRLKNFMIGYNFKSEGLTNVGIQNIKVSLVGENLWTYTPLHKIAPNIDPEAGPAPSEADVSGGTSGDGLNYPILKGWSLGVSVSF